VAHYIFPLANRSIWDAKTKQKGISPLYFGIRLLTSNRTRYEPIYIDTIPLRTISKAFSIVADYSVFEARHWGFWRRNWRIVVNTNAILFSA